MAVFPDDLQKLNSGDIKQSIAQLENYIRYMSERIEFANHNLVRIVNETDKKLKALDDRLKALEEKGE